MAGWTVIDNTWLKENGPGCWTKLSIANEYAQAHYERGNALIPGGGALNLFVEDGAATNSTRWYGMQSSVVSWCNGSKFIQCRYYDSGSDSWLQWSNFNGESSIPLWDWVTFKKAVWNKIRSTAANNDETIPFQHTWVATNNYWKGDIVQYDATPMKYFECKVECIVGDAGNDDPETDTTNWRDLEGGENSTIAGFRRCPRQKFIVPKDEWVATTSYSTGDRVWHSSPLKYYRCISNIAGDPGNDPPASDTTHWAEVLKVPNDGWPADWTDYADPAYSYGPIQDGDIRGPWNLWDLQHCFNEMIWVRLRSQDDGDPGDDGCGYVEYDPDEPSSPPAWDANTEYDVHDYVTYGGTVYECRRNDWDPPPHPTPPNDLFDEDDPTANDNHWVVWSPPRKYGNSGDESPPYLLWADAQTACTTNWTDHPWLDNMGSQAHAWARGDYVFSGMDEFTVAASRRRCKVQTKTNTWDDRDRAADYYGYYTLEDVDREIWDDNGDSGPSAAGGENKYGMFGTEIVADGTGQTWTSTPACGDENRNSMPAWPDNPKTYPSTTWKGWKCVTWAVVLRWDLISGNGFEFF